MRIAFISYEYPPFVIGGAGTYAYNITKEIAELGHEVVVFTPYVTDCDPPPGVKIAGVPVDFNRPLVALQFWRGLPRTLKVHQRDGEFDIIHYNGITYWHLRKMTSAAMVVTIHHLTRDAAIDGRYSLLNRIAHLNDEAGLVMPWFEKRAVRQSERLITVSKFTQKRLIEEYGLNAEKIAVIYNGYNYETTDHCDLVNAKRLIGDKGGKTILFVGRIDNKRKGLDDLVRALPLIVSVHDDVSLVVVGGGDKQEVEGLAAELQVSDRIILTGFVDDPTLVGLYRLCDVYVSPSLMEGFGITILDAQRLAKKVVATRVGAVPEIAGAGTILVPPGDVEGLAQGIIEALASPHPGGSMAQEEHVLNSPFSWKVAAKRTLSEYMRLLEHA